jgi:hypothetical protein
MGALSAAFTPSPSEIEIDEVTIPMAASAVIYPGGMVSIDSAGHAIDASDTASTKFVGKARFVGSKLDNTGGNAGDLSVTVRLSRRYKGYIWDNYATAPLVQASLFATAYVQDDHTVAVSSGQSISAGTFFGFPIDNTGTAITTKAIVVGTL